MCLNEWCRQGIHWRRQKQNCICFPFQTAALRAAWATVLHAADRFNCRCAIGTGGMSSSGRRTQPCFSVRWQHGIAASTSLRVDERRGEQRADEQSGPLRESGCLFRTSRSPARSIRAAQPAPVDDGSGRPPPHCAHLSQFHSTVSQSDRWGTGTVAEARNWSLVSDAPCGFSHGGGAQWPSGPPIAFACTITSDVVWCLRAAGLAVAQSTSTTTHRQRTQRHAHRPPFLCLPLPGPAPLGLSAHPLSPPRHASPLSAHRMRVRAAGTGRRSVQRVQVQRLHPVRIRGLRFQVSVERRARAATSPHRSCCPAASAIATCRSCCPR